MTRLRKALFVALSILTVFAMMLPAQALTKRVNIGTIGCTTPGQFVHLVFKHNGPAGATVNVQDPNLWVHTTNPWATSPNAIIHAPSNTQFFVGTTIDVNLGVKKVFGTNGWSSWVDFQTSAPVVPNVTLTRWYCAP